MPGRRSRPSRSAMDRRRPSRARSTRAGSNPAPRSRTVTCRRPVAGLPVRRGEADLTQASPVPACAATFDSASRAAFDDRRDDPGRDGGRFTVADDPTWTVSPRARISAATARTAPSRSPAGPGRPGRVIGVAERGLDQGHVLPAPVHHPGRVIGRRPGPAR